MGLLELRAVESIEQVEPTQHVFVGVEIFRPLAADAAQLGVTNMWRDRLQDMLSQPVLQREQVARISFESVGRDHRPAFRIGQLSGNPQPVVAMPYRS